MLQPPQCLASVWVSTQPAPGQQLWPAVQASPPLQMHTVFPLFLPQASPALQVEPSHTHSPEPVLQLEFESPPVVRHCEFSLQPQTLFLQANPPDAPCDPQLFSQVPQCVLAVARLVSQPLSGPVVGLLQSPNPAWQVWLHALAAQVAAVEFSVLHLREQAPQ